MCFFNQICVNRKKFNCHSSKLFVKMPVWLYHYTDVNAAASIESLRLIYQSTDTIRDAAWGRGTYFTDMAPHNHTAQEIAHNNWRSSLTTTIQQRIEYCIKVKFDRGDIEDCSANGRRIFVYRGNVNLTRQVYSIFRCSFLSQSDDGGSSGFGGFLAGLGIVAAVIAGVAMAASGSRKR